MPKDTKVCSLRGCSRPALAKGHCQVHYMRVRRGSPNALVPELLHRGTRTEKVSIRVTPETIEWAKAKASESDQPMAEWLAEKLERDRLRSASK